MKNIFAGIFTASVLVLSYSTPTLAWGGRGHHALCHAAVFLVKEDGLKEFLLSRPHMMGHLCNIPDIYWRNIPKEQTALGNPSHYFNVEHVAKEPKDVPLDYAELTKKWAGKESAYSKGKKLDNFHADVGSLWWRADQFYRRATDEAKEWKKLSPPADYKEQTDENLPYNKMTYNFIVNLGLMGHFVGDASMPFHSSADHDGWDKGHGGIHSYYEDAGVAMIPPDLEPRIVEAGKKYQEKKPKFLTESSVVARMRALSETAFPEMEKVLAIDKVSKPSEKSAGEKGSKKPAERAKIEEVASQFEPMIIDEMGRSAALLAELWDEAYVKVGRPKISGVRMYNYPLTPDFVPPDYLGSAK